jgi:uncharacterized membrane protein
MSAPTGTPDRITELAAELGRLGRRLDDMGSELLTLAAGPGHVPQPPDGPLYPDRPQYPGTQPYQGIQPYQGARAHPGVQPPPGAPQLPGPAPRPPRPARGRVLGAWVSSLSGARLLAWTGGAVTLLGVAMLLVLAASRGWFSPGARVGLGAVLGLALVGLAVRLHRKDSPVGAPALAGTGVAALYLDVAAATALYGFLPDVAGLALALLVAAGGIALADAWRSRLLAVGAVVGAAVLAPFVTDGFTPLLVALVLALQVAAAAAVVRRGWPTLVPVAAAWPALYGMVAAGTSWYDSTPAAIAASVAVLVVGVAVTAPMAVRPATGAGAVAAAVAVSPLPTLTVGALLQGWRGAVLAAGAAVVLLGFSAWPAPAKAIRITALTAGAVALFQATMLVFDGAPQHAVLLGQGVVLAVLAAVLKARLPLLVGGVYGAVGVLLAVAEEVPPQALAAFPRWPFLAGAEVRTGALVAALGLSALILALAVAVLAAAGRTGVVRADSATAGLWVPTGLVGLYGAAGLVLAAALLISPDRDGFLLGHAAVTVSWAVAALVLLARGISRAALRVTGLVLVGAAMAKLVLFDLTALDGLARVAAFLGAGLVLLAAGTRYAKVVAAAQEEPARAEETPSTPAGA